MSDTFKEPHVKTAEIFHMYFLLFFRLISSFLLSSKIIYTFTFTLHVYILHKHTVYRVWKRMDQI